MKHKVIFDTSLVWNNNPTDFAFGKKDELARFAKVSELIFPSMVIEEIKSQKRQLLNRQKKNLVENPIIDALGITSERIETFSVDDIIPEKINDGMDYQIINLTRPPEKAFEEIIDMALNKKPPFSEDRNSDSGFKDAYIFLTVLDFLENNEDENIFFVTANSKDLKRAFDGNQRVTVVENYDQFNKVVFGDFNKPPFLKHLGEKLKFELQPENIGVPYQNYNGNWIIRVLTDTMVFYVKLDTQLKVDTLTSFDFTQIINNLVHSASFMYTHYAIASLQGYDVFFDFDQTVNLVRAATENDQIFSIAQDPDVKEFFSKLYDNNKPRLTDETLKRKFQLFFSVAEVDPLADIPF